MMRLAATCAAVLAVLCGAVIAHAATRTLDARAELKTTKRDGLRATQKGTLDAKPFGRGTLVLDTFIQKGKVRASFTARIGSATVRGTAYGDVDIRKRIRYDGTARITGGTGRFRNASGSGLKFRGDGPLNGRSSVITIRGRVRY